MPGPTQMQRLMMELVERLHASLKHSRPKAPYPTRDEIHANMDWDKPPASTGTRIRSLLERGWLKQHKFEDVKGYAYSATKKYHREKKDPPLMNRGAKPEIRSGNCASCGRSFNRLSLFGGKYLCRSCLCPDEELSVFDYMYTGETPLGQNVHGQGG